VKQLGGDPFADFVAQAGKGSVVKGTVTEVDDKQVSLQLADGVSGLLRASEVSRDLAGSLTQHFRVGDDVEVSIVNVDRRNRSIQLSQRPVDAQADQQALRTVREQPVVSTGPTTIGDLIKAQMSKSDD